MTKPRSDPRSGASSSQEDAAALRRELYRPGADRAAVEAYLAALPAVPAEVARHAKAVPAPQHAPAPEPVETGVPPLVRRRRRTGLLLTAALAVPVAGLAVLPRAEPARRPTPSPAASATTAALRYAPTRITGLRGSTTLVVGLPFRTNRLRIRIECSERPSAYTWTASGQDGQTEHEQFIPVLSHSGPDCSPTATYVGGLPGDISAVRIRVLVDGPYALTIEPV